MRDPATGNPSDIAATPEGNLSRRVSQIMAETFVTLDQLAVELACTKDAIWRLRSGKTRKADLAMLVEVARWARRMGYSLDWLMLGVEPARLPDELGVEREKAIQIANRASVIISIGAMAKALKLDITDITGRWAARMAQGDVPEIDGMELLQRINDFLRQR
jgi:hypothetical protein